MSRTPTDDELLRMLHEAEAAADEVDEAARAMVDDPPFDPCPFCGEPAPHLGVCRVCHENGCLPGDVWTPGQPDPCLTLCVRCAREIHVACAADDEAGNPRCPTCAF